MKEQTHLIAEYLKSFLLHFLPLEKGVSENTVLSYRDTIKLMLCFAEKHLRRSIDKLTVEDLDMKLVLAFLDHLEQERGCSANTRNQRLAALRTLYKYIARQAPELALHSQQVCSISMKAKQDAPVEYLTDNELGVLTAAIDQNTTLGVRDYALVLLLFNTGARVSELTNLHLDDLTLDHNPKIDIIAKGRKPRSCVLWDETVKALRNYLQARCPRHEAESHLFLNAVNNPLGRFGVNHILKKYAHIAEEQCPSLAKKKISPHIMRHSTAMHLLILGIEIAMIALWLGHSSLETTNKYVECNMEMKRKIIETVPAPQGTPRRRKWQNPKTLAWLESLRNGHPNYVEAGAL